MHWRAPPPGELAHKHSECRKAMQESATSDGAGWSTWEFLQQPAIRSSAVHISAATQKRKESCGPIKISSDASMACQLAGWICWSCCLLLSCNDALASETEPAGILIAEGFESAPAMSPDQDAWSRKSTCCEVGCPSQGRHASDHKTAQDHVAHVADTHAPQYES